MILSDPQIQSMSQLLRCCGQTIPPLMKQSFEVYEKGYQDYVTDIDHALDQQLTSGFQQIFPTEHLITEENTESWTAFHTEAERLWLIDPLDGTEDFIQGDPNFVLMAGLLVQHQPQIGWIYAPMFDRLYWGGPDYGLFQVEADGPPQPLQPLQPASPSDAFCPILLGHKDRKRFGEAILQQLPAAQFDCIGSFGLKVMRVITGQAGIYVYLNGRVKLWDTTGPLAMARASGLVCCDLQGDPLRFAPDAINPTTLAHQQTIVIGWPHYVETLLPQIQQAVMEQTSRQPAT